VTGPDPRERFGPRAQAYARARPGYPDEIAREVARRLELAPGATVIDLGAGTGLSARPFVALGFRVIAVEPNAAMREASPLRDAPGLAWVPGSAEATGLAPACADLVIAAQAFHWFDPARARAEALRVLRPPARAALFWNDRREEGSAFARGYEALLRRHSREYLELRERHASSERLRAFFGAPWMEFTLAHADRLDRSRLHDRTESASYLPAPGMPGHGALIAELDALFDATQDGGSVTMEYETRVLLGPIAPGTGLRE